MTFSWLWAVSRVLFLATGIVTVRRPVLPRWLGWVAIVIGVIALAGPLGFVGLILSILWLLVVSIMMLVRKDLIAAGAFEGAEVIEVVVETTG